MRRNPNVKWTDVHGNDEAKQVLRDCVILPQRYPHLFSGVARPWKGILMHGPPGIGKTMLAKALCSESFASVTFFNVSSSTIISKWRGESEKFIKVTVPLSSRGNFMADDCSLLQVLFTLAVARAPSIIFIDEFEALATKRDSLGEHEASRRFKNEFLIQFDESENAENGNVLLLANSNLPWYGGHSFQLEKTEFKRSGIYREIDPAFLRRFDKKLLIDLPTGDARVALMKQLSSLNPETWTEKQIASLTLLTEGFTGAEIKSACKDFALKRIYAAIDRKESQGLGDAPCFDDLMNALKRIPATMTSSAEKHRKWHQTNVNKIIDCGN